MGIWVIVEARPFPGATKPTAGSSKTLATEGSTGLGVVNNVSLPCQHPRHPLALQEAPPALSGVSGTSYPQAAHSKKWPTQMASREFSVVTSPSGVSRNASLRKSVPSTRLNEFNIQRSLPAPRESSSVLSLLTPSGLDANDVSLTRRVLTLPLAPPNHFVPRLPRTLSRNPTTTGSRS